MKQSMVALLSSLGVAAAQAQAPAQAPTQYGPDNGFFRPSPDVALTASKANASGTSGQAATQPFQTLQSPTLPGVVGPVPTFIAPVPNAVPMSNPAAQVSGIQPPAVQQPVPTPPQQGQVQPAAAPPAAEQAAVERQMDRSVAEAERERGRMQSSPSGVGAAFDGTTSSENR